MKISIHAPNKVADYGKISEMGQREEKRIPMPRKSKIAGHRIGKISIHAPNRVAYYGKLSKKGQREEKRISMPRKPGTK